MEGLMHKLETHILQLVFLQLVHSLSVISLSNGVCRVINDKNCGTCSGHLQIVGFSLLLYPVTLCCSEKVFHHTR